MPQSQSIFFRDCLYKFGPGFATKFCGCYLFVVLLMNPFVIHNMCAVFRVEHAQLSWVVVERSAYEDNDRNKVSASDRMCSRISGAPRHRVHQVGIRPDNLQVKVKQVLDRLHLLGQRYGNIRFKVSHR